jgi:hypothetical protein
VAEFLRELALAVAPTVAAKLLDAAIEARRARAVDPTPESFAAYVAERRR